MSVKEQELSPMQSGKPQHWFISDIQLMMHGMGDCNKPLHESAVLVEEITHQQMITVLHRALEVASLRGTKTLGLEDFLFLMRKDKVKLRRLLRYMHLKDKKAQLHKASSLDEEDATETDIKPATTGRRRKTCYEFLSSIDQTGELCALFEDEEEDEIKYERLLRAELTSRCMDPQQYLEFSEARCTNFSRKTQKFRDWMFSGLEAEVKPNQYALEVLSYLAYETVAQIVDLALLVKQDMLTGFRDPLSQTLPNISHNINQSNSGVGQSGMKPDLASPLASPPTTPVTSQPSLMGITMVTQGASGKAKQKKKRKGHPYSLDIPREKAIQPGEIREAMRRYCAFIGPFASQMKHSSMLSPKFLKLCI